MLFALLNLLNNNCSATTLGLKSKLFTLILCLKSFETLDLHHKVQTLLLSDPFSLQLLVLLKLLVTHSDDLGVEGHLIHVLDVVVLLIKLGLGLGEQGFGALVLLNLDLRGRQLLGTVAVHALHLGLASLGSCLLLGLLLLSNAFRLLRVRLCNHLGSLPHASNIGSSENSSLTGGILFLFIQIISHGAELIRAHNRHVRVCWLRSGR